MMNSDELLRRCLKNAEDTAARAMPGKDTVAVLLTYKPGRGWRFMVGSKPKDVEEMTASAPFLRE